MNNYKSQIEIFPDELFLDLFSYIPPSELFYAWFGLNRRISAIIRSIHISFNLIESTKENIRALDYFSKQIIFLHIRIPCQTLDLRKYPNLCSLIIDTKLTKQQLDSIRPSYLPNLKRLTFSKWSRDEETLNETIFTRLSSDEKTIPWIKVYHLPTMPKHFMMNFSSTSCIRTMIFDRVTPSDIDSILYLQPMLCHLKVTIVRWMFEDSTPNISLTDRNYQHKHLIHLDVTMNTCNRLDDLYLLLSHLPFLRTLYIACDNLMMDDFERLALVLVTQTTRLKSFNCSFKQTYIEPIEKLHCICPLFRHMKCKRIEWNGGWHYYCVTTKDE